jgi:outer membrane lipoprotein carrier protein
VPWGNEIQESGVRMRMEIRAHAASVLGLFVLCFLGAASNLFCVDLETVVTGLQQRYASAITMTGSFQQTYRAPGIEQVESGVFRMKRPGHMRWEYRTPEEKLFVADGREAFLYVPSDRQVTVQSFSAFDMRGTPLEFLLGSAEIRKSFAVSWENNFKPDANQTLLIRMTPRDNQSEYEFLVLALDPKTYDLRRISIHEHGGNTSEFLLSNMTANAKIDNKEFQFKPPKGTEIIRMEEGK